MAYCLGLIGFCLLPFCELYGCDGKWLARGVFIWKVDVAWDVMGLSGVWKEHLLM